MLCKLIPLNLLLIIIEVKQTYSSDSTGPPPKTPADRSRICSSLLVQDDGADAGAAHGDEARLQTEVVTVPRPFLRADLAQQQHLPHDGFGLQAQVLLALRVQTALEQAAGLCQRWEERGVPGDAAQRAEEQKPVSKCVCLHYTPKSSFYQQRGQFGWSSHPLSNILWVKTWF